MKVTFKWPWISRIKMKLLLAADEKRHTDNVSRLRTENKKEKAELLELVRKFRKFEVRFDRNTQSFQLLIRVDSRVSEMGMDTHQWRYVAECIGRTIEHELSQFDFIRAKSDAQYPSLRAGMLGAGDFPGDDTTVTKPAYNSP